MSPDHVTHLFCCSLCVVDLLLLADLLPLWTGEAGAPAMTSGSSSQPDGESSPAQALVPPLVLTHLIEGFVIQEGAEPFPVSGEEIR